jgi:hypothetical protein
VTVIVSQSNNYTHRVVEKLTGLMLLQSSLRTDGLVFQLGDRRVKLGRKQQVIHFNSMNAKVYHLLKDPQQSANIRFYGVLEGGDLMAILPYYRPETTRDAIAAWLEEGGVTLPPIRLKKIMALLLDLRERVDRVEIGETHDNNRLEIIEDMNETIYDTILEAGKEFKQSAEELYSLVEAIIERSLSGQLFKAMTYQRYRLPSEETIAIAWDLEHARFKDKIAGDQPEYLVVEEYEFSVPPGKKVITFNINGLMVRVRLTRRQIPFRPSP